MFKTLFYFAIPLTICYSQLFDNKALLTYKNTLKGTDDKGEADIEKYSWADIYVKQGDSWRVLGIHEIDSRIEYFDK